MKLILIYGPPAVGKFTVAKALSELTGLKFLHNHLVADLARAIFDYGNDYGRIINQKIRFLIYREAREMNLSGIVTTFSYYGDGNVHSRNDILDVMALAKETGIEVFFVRLFCGQEELERRVQNFSRLGTRKIKDVAKLRKVLKEETPDAEIPARVVATFNIDNTLLPPEEAALKIRLYCDL